MPSSQPIPLSSHPSTPAPTARRISVQVDRKAASLSLRFQLDAPLHLLSIPSAATPRAVLGLWEHTCFEAFVAVDGAEAYHELNLSPSGEWAVFSFDRYRDGFAICLEETQPQIVVTATPERLELSATIALDPLSPRYRDAPLRVAAAAVVESADGALSYWALHHPPGKADFHHRDAFVLRLEATQAPE